MPTLGVALVTGASRGIGRAIALQLAKDGFDVGINDLPASREGLESLRAQIKEKGRRSTIVAGDVSVKTNTENMVSTVVKDLGRLDVVGDRIHGIQPDVIPTHPITEKRKAQAKLAEVEEWDKLFAVNGRGVFLCYKYAALQMIKQGQGGRIIGASSIVGRQGEPNLGAYSATKFAVRGLTQAAVKEFADNMKVPLDDLRAKFGDASAVGYNGKPEDVANVVSFLASKDAHFITVGC
ncbi:hypothetical protein C0995_004133 [Termitomyces sp. Mi166|nr:hypothetical protein C0995_004133 [Termitomyces sp. Mi166\